MALAIAVAATATGCSRGTSSGTRRPAVPRTATTAPVTTAPAPVTRVLLEVVAPDESPTCHQASTATEPAALISAFRAARLAGRDAEECLTAGALASYADARCDEQALVSSPGPLVLYRCGTHRVIDMPDDSIVVSSWGIELDVVLDGRNSAGQPNRLPENLTIGPGVPATGGEPEPQLVTAVDNN